MNKEFLLIGTEPGGAEIIRVSDIKKVYIEMPEANNIIIIWNDDTRNGTITTTMQCKTYSKSKRNAAIPYFNALIEHLDASPLGFCCKSWAKDVVDSVIHYSYIGK